MELDARHYARVDLSDAARDVWRRHACVPRDAPAAAAAAYAAAAPLLCAAARALVVHHAWRPAPAPDDDALFAVHHPASDAPLALPRTLTALRARPAAAARMLAPLLPVHLGADGRLCVPAPLADLFQLLQLLVPGAFALVKAEYASHELDDDGDVAWVSWRTYARALPPPAWMDAHAPQLRPVFGGPRWAALRRAAADCEVFADNDVTFA